MDYLFKTTRKNNNMSDFNYLEPIISNNSKNLYDKIIDIFDSTNISDKRKYKLCLLLLALKLDGVIMKNNNNLPNPPQRVSHSNESNKNNGSIGGKKKISSKKKTSTKSKKTSTKSKKTSSKKKTSTKK